MLRKLIRNKTVFAGLNIAVGIYMCIAGQGAVYDVVRVAGYALLAAAAAYLVLYFRDSRMEKVQLGYAAAAGIAGLLIIRFAPAVVNLFPALAGLALVLAGAGNLTHAFREDALPGTSKVGPIVTIVLGALILLHPGAILGMAVRLAGVALILNGLSELDMIRRIW